jgi:capsular exopolysaccharide synthesis family protein
MSMTDGTKGDRPLPTRQSPAMVPAYPAAPPAYFMVDEPSGSGPIGIGAFLRRHRWTILGALAVVVPLTAFFTSTRPTIYESYSSFLVESSGGGGAAPLEVLARAGKAGTMLTESELLMSRRVVASAVREFGLNLAVVIDEESKPVTDVFPSFSVGEEIVPGAYRVEPAEDGSYTVTNESTSQVVARSEPDSAIRFAGVSLAPPAVAHEEGWLITVRSMDGAVGATRGRISAAPQSPDSDILLLTCRGSSPDAAQELCDVVTRSYMALQLAMQRSEANAAVAFLEEQLEKVEPRLEATEDSLRNYQEANLAVALEASAANAIGTQSNFQARRDELAAERAALRSLIGNIESGEGGYATYPTLIRGNPVIGNLLGSMVDLDNRRAELAKTRTERNPDVIAIDSRIVAIKNQLSSIATTHDRALSAQISSLDGAAGQAAGRASMVPRRQIESGRLERQVALLDEAYRGLQTKLRDAQMAQSISLPSVRIVDAASTPMGPVSPNWQLNMALGIVLGLAFGVALALWRDYTDTRVRGRKSLEEGTGIPVLAMLPSVKNGGAILPVSRTGSGESTGPIVKAVADIDREIAREAFWSLVTDLRFAARRLDNGGLRSLAVTSTTRGEGKTFSACNLALAESNSSMRTLLIDADLRGKGATRFFGIGAATPGLSDVIFGSLEPRDAWRPLTVDGRGELYVLPAGRVAPEHREPLRMDRVARLLTEAEGRFDLVIVDTPPLNIVTDAAAVAASVDGVIVIVRGGLTDRSALDLTLDRLKRANANVMGMVLNDVDLPESYTSYSHLGVDDDVSS